MYGLVMLIPQYLLETEAGIDFPPPITPKRTYPRIFWRGLKARLRNEALRRFRVFQSRFPL